MASIHELPLRYDRVASLRLNEELSALVASGIDPGPRRYQIAVIRDSIRAALEALPDALAAAAEPLAAGDDFRRQAEKAVEDFKETVERLLRTTAP